MKQTIDASPDKAVAEVVERPLVFGKVGGGKPLADHHIRVAVQYHICHPGGGFERVGVVTVNQNITFGINLTKHAADDISLSLQVFLSHNCARFGGDRSRIVGGIVIIYIDNGIRQSGFGVPYHLFYGGRFVIAGNQHCGFV